MDKVVVAKHYSSGGPGGSFDDLPSNEEFESSERGQALIHVDVLGANSEGENVQDSYDDADDEDEEEGNIASTSSDEESVQPEAEKGNSTSEVVDDSQDESGAAVPSSQATEKPQPFLNVRGRYFDEDDGSPEFPTAL